MWRKRIMLFIVVMAVFLMPNVVSAGKNQPGWIQKENGRSYWKLSNGKILKGPGIHTLNGKKYYLNPGGSRVVDAWRTVDGKSYYFQKNGVMYRKKGWMVWNGDKYYMNAGGSCRKGFQQVPGGRMYYFDNKGRLYTKQGTVEIDNKFYDVDKYCHIKQMPEYKVRCSQETQKFIARHTNPSMSNAQKFRACFNYIMAFTNFLPVAWKDPTTEQFQNGTWPYIWALDMLETNLTGGCYGVASLVASCAKELGYEPYVVAMAEDHGFVMIDGLYYDNMGPLFGSTTHFPYTVAYKTKF